MSLIKFVLLCFLLLEKYISGKNSGHNFLQVRLFNIFPSVSQNKEEVMIC